MVLYKEKYLKTKKQLIELESNCIDLRNHKKGQILTFSKDKWRYIGMKGNFIILDKI